MIENAKENSQRVELKDRIIETASEAFTAHGIKSITMDDIAASLGISKRTLYEVFQDKELADPVYFKTSGRDECFSGRDLGQLKECS